ncbi:DUF3139 domain-containing protein [Domibacillus aminovorans]|uniref:Uncharacterized protein n=1 Tax=Domibacillus aminovorans TaxID=29332 RepID=A0A177L5E3_9BACI|nr:DUF3139 domain-containing protein [Domibacillus aminovorans]OAH60898.1 hypothetical protein AWH49_14725 [Domibacillus aminovorans]
MNDRIGGSKIKKKIVNTVLTLLITVALGVYYILPNPFTGAQLEKDVREYLYNEQGIMENDILRLEVRSSSLENSGEDRYLAVVYFKDEPELDYGYEWDAEGKIVPAYITFGNHNPKHYQIKIESSETNLSIAVSNDIKNKIKEMADQEETSMQEITSRIIEEFFSKRDQE